MFSRIWLVCWWPAPSDSLSPWPTTRCRYSVTSPDKELKCLTATSRVLQTGWCKSLNGIEKNWLFCRFEMFFKDSDITLVWLFSEKKQLKNLPTAGLAYKVLVHITELLGRTFSMMLYKHKPVYERICYIFRMHCPWNEHPDTLPL